jgi:hypothetical protein
VKNEKEERLNDKLHTGALYRSPSRINVKKPVTS